MTVNVQNAVTDISSTDFSGSESGSEIESDLNDFNSYTTAQSGVGAAGETDGSLMTIIKSKSARNTSKSSSSHESRGSSVSRDAFTKMLQNANYEDNENNNIEENRSQMSNLEIFEVFKQNSLSEINKRIKVILPKKMTERLVMGDSDKTK